MNHSICLDHVIKFVILQPKYGGMIIDIVSGDIKSPGQQAEALDAIKNTVVAILLIVVVGYVHSFLFFCCLTYTLSPCKF